ncbi:MAG: efflux RND transporter permease subunit, partial [Geovibrio sp.]|nr:efflux RND transporter permease subunit [Geovibrio sp.]
MKRKTAKGTAGDVLDRLREKLQFFPGAEIKVEKEENGPPVGDPVSIEIGGEDVSILERLTNQVKAEVKEVYGIVDLKDNLVKSKPEISVRVDREKAALLGLSTADISYTLKAAIGGYKLGVYREGDDEYDIVARLPEERRRSVADIANLLVPNSGGNPIPLSEIATVETGTGYGSIKRKDGKRVVTVSAGVEGRNSNDALQEIMQKVAKIELPNGYSIKYSGEQEEQQKATAFLEKAFIIALFMIALVLVTQFNSIRQSGIVLTSVVLSLSGVLMGLLIMRMPFGIIMTGVGVISLAGVVVNNA